MRQFFIASILVLAIGSIGIFGAAWLKVDEYRFSKVEKIEITIIEPSRYLESGYYAPVDTNGDGKPDNWVSGDFQAGETVLASEGSEFLSAEPNFMGRLSVILLFGVAALAIVVLALIISSGPLRTLMRAQQAQRWRQGRFEGSL